MQCFVDCYNDMSPPWISRAVQLIGQSVWASSEGVDWARVYCVEEERGRHSAWKG